MSEIILSNVSKSFNVGQDIQKYALKNINISFKSGLVCILGKSGSGKTTLLNMIGMLDFPTNGKVIIDGKDINKLSKKDKNKFRKNKCSFIFQHYHLLEDQTALFNVVLPSLIDGKNYKKVESKAINLFKNLGFDNSKMKQKVSTLSGGEKERVAIIRAIINEPDILLADEPTGALDSKNSLEIMHILKKISETRLVIMVTHNEDLSKEFADRIINIKDGEISEDTKINETFSLNNEIKKQTFSKSDIWSSKIVVGNLKKRFLRNLISCFSLIVSIVSTLLIIGFSYGSKASIEAETLKRLDIGVGSISKEVSNNVNGSSFSLIKTSRPQQEDLIDIKEQNTDFLITYNYEALLSGYQFYIGDKDFNEIIYAPIYSFQGDSINKNLLIKGKIPYDSLNECLINASCYKYLKEKTGIDPINYSLNLKVINQFNYYTGDEVRPYITDYFTYEKEITIKGVVNECEFLSTPKLYYPYIKLEEYVENTPLNNLSEYIGDEINWYQRIVDVSDNDVLSSYSFFAFLKDYSKVGGIKDFKTSENIKYTNNGIVIGETLKQLIDASCIGMELFLVIAIVGCCLILGILSFSSYSEDRKKCAILECLGAEKSKIEEIYMTENILLSLISSIFSLFIAFFVTNPLNMLLKRIFGFDSLIEIPFKSFLGFKYFLPFIIVLAAIFVASISTILPIKFSKKISLKEELADE